MASDDILPVENEAIENDLDSESCQKLVEEFASVTNTDEALAQFYLQDHSWKLEPSLNAYYEAQNDSNRGGGRPGANGANDDEVLVTFQSMVSGFHIPGKVTMKPPQKFKFMTWNIDGLDDHNLKKRTKAVFKIIEMEKPDVVFLQEAIPVTFSYLEDHLPQYMFIAGGTEEYFVATLLRQTTVYFDGHSIQPFSNSRMGRNILFVDCHIGSLKLRLINSHLESTQDGAVERKDQLRTALRLLKAGSKEHTSIFAGDLNLRDREAMEVQIPHDVYDLWEACGRRNECKFTWDTLRNSNTSFPSKFRPRARYDRVYLHQSEPPSIKPEHFGLVGIQKVTGTQSFPSDHWGISVYFEILNQTAVTSSPPPSHSDPNRVSKPSTSSSDLNKTVECLDLSEDSIHIINTPDGQKKSDGGDQISESLNNTCAGKRKRALIDLE